MMQANNLHRAGLYVPEMESDSCGTGLIANLDGVATHKLVADALLMLQNMEHRGACGCEPNTGDGAGILIQTPHQFFEEEAKRHGFLLPEFGSYGVGMLFLPKDKNWKDRCLSALSDCLNWLNFRLVGYRPVPVEPAGLGASALATEPDMVQIFVRHTEGLTKLDLERKLFVLRNFATREVHRHLPEELRDLFYFASLSYKTIVYKGQLTTWQLPTYFPDLQDKRLTSAIALIHSRFSTNTFPKWKLAQPFRYIAHNGEINTLTGNLNWWKSRENNLDSEHFSTEELSQLKPVCPEGQSDSAYFDNVLEMMVMGGRSLPHSMMMMIPEAWEHDEQMPDFKKAFYEYHENLLEPWDGPASLVFTNGILVGATLDRNGLRPSRYCLTNDNVLILASEAGALPVEPGKIVMKGRLQPGKMLVADLDMQRIIGDEEVKNIICKRLPYRDWLDKYRLRLDDLSPSAEPMPAPLSGEELLRCQQLFGYTREDLKVILEPMAKTGEEPVGSMGTDTPLAALSSKPQHLANYFKQLFAQVTNPPIDPIRERMVMSLASKLGNGGNFLSIGLEHARFIRLEQPVLNEEDFLKIKNIWHPLYRSATLDLRFKADGKPGRLRNAIEKLCRQAEELVKEGVNILILSDKPHVSDTWKVSDTWTSGKLPIPTLLATGAIHHHLIHAGLRVKTSLLVEAGDAWETHHFAALIGFGANAVHPWLALASVSPNSSLADAPPPNWSSAAQKNFSKAIQKGLLKIMSKNGVSTLQSYHGSQIFEALGLNFEVVENCFPGTISRIEGLGFDDLAAEIQRRQPSQLIPRPSPLIPPGGVFSWRQDGETHNLNPQSIHLLQFSTRRNDYAAYKKYAALMNREDEQAVALRSLLKFKKGNPVPLDEVEPVENILKRFASGAMSFGSISHEAHSTLAIAMNRIGAKSNCGEGGEDPARFERKPNGDWERSAIKQVASGRFGVTSHYLTNAAELQIKMAQGAKPGEGGQLPGHKVDEWIARVRHSTPGVGLISPPPHHDIYSIEDLAQLIFDLKNANRDARISVKLVSKAGVGVIASGVAKAHADVILIAGHDGGTGASPLTSIRHAGLPWELGIAEAHQTLVRNKLR
ncbi:MAG: glutamate synthase large subunit, partial [Bacteroidota bacterium]